MEYRELSQKLREIRRSEGSMMDIALRMHQTSPFKKQGTYMQSISFFENGWAELGYALEGRQPWKTYLDLYFNAVNLSDEQKREVDGLVKKALSSR